MVFFFSGNYVADFFTPAFIIAVKELHPSLFTSYYYLEPWTKDGQRQLAVLQTLSPYIDYLVVDSGAFSYFTATPSIERRSILLISEKRQAALPSPDKYFDRYLGWLKETQDTGLWDYAVELDLDAIVGLAKVKRWRKQFERAGLAHRIICVWHVSMNKREWQRLIDHALACGINYIGIGLGSASTPARHAFWSTYARPLVYYAYERGVRVHIFACAALQQLLKAPFYSADSVSWRAPFLLGELPHFLPAVCMLEGRRLDASLPQQKKRCLADPRYITRLDERFIADYLASPKARRRPRHNQGAYIETMRRFLALQDFVTRYWERLGFTWEPLPHYRSEYNRPAPDS